MYIILLDLTSLSTIYTTPDVSPSRRETGILTVEAEVSGDDEGSPRKLNISPRRHRLQTRLSAPRRAFWKNTQRSLSPLRQSHIVEKRFRSSSPKSVVKNPKLYEDILYALKTSFKEAINTYYARARSGEDINKIQQLLKEIRAQIDDVFGVAPPSLTTLDPATTRSALDTYSGKLIELIQSKVEEALSASIASRQTTSIGQIQPFRNHSQK
jgi:hypothetical protein